MDEAQAVIARVLELSGKSGLRAKPRLLGGGEINDTYVLHLESDEVLVLRIARYGNQHSLANEARALNMLNIEQVPRLVFFDADERINGKPWILESYMSGETVERLSLAQFHSLGQLLATVHQHKDASTRISLWEKFLGANSMFGNEEKILNHPDAGLQQLVASAKDYFNKQQSLFDDVALCLVHGDATPSNILTNGNEVSLIDWEFSNFNDPMAEFSTIYYDDMEYNRGKWRVHISPDEREALFNGYRENGGVLDMHRIAFWMIFDKLGAALYLYWRVHGSERKATDNQRSQYALDLKNLMNSLDKSLG